MEQQIILNQIRTPDGTVLRSMYTHDYVSYKDANGETYMVDGGREYLRRNVNVEPYEELSVYSDAPFEEIRKALHRGGRGPSGTEPLKYVPICEMSDSWLKAIIEYNELRGLADHPATQFYRQEVEYRKEHSIFIPDVVHDI